MSSIQRQARALGDPTRHEIFQYLADADHPVDVAELTGHLGLNHNAIRQHLAKLVEAELAIEDTAPPGGRGRPRLRYTLDPNTESRWGVGSPYERLSLLLSEIVRTGDTPEQVGRRAIRRQRLGAGGADDPVGEIVDQMARQGFDPIVKRNGADADLTLRHCPFVAVALADPDTVCGLHLGMAYGIADAVGGLVIDELVPRDPRRANCRLRCHIEAPESTAKVPDHKRR